MFALLVAMSVITTRTAQLDVPSALDNLAALETGGRVHDGAAGEKGPYQIKLSVWRQWSDKPFSFAEIDSAETQRVVVCQLRFIMEKLEERNIRPTPELIATCWNAGLTAVLDRRTTWQQRDFGVRFGRLYRSSLGGRSAPKLMGAVPALDVVGKVVAHAG
jgi:hypothetical protein